MGMIQSELNQLASILTGGVASLTGVLKQQSPRDISKKERTVAQGKTAAAIRSKIDPPAINLQQNKAAYAENRAVLSANDLIQQKNRASFHVRSRVGVHK